MATNTVELPGLGKPLNYMGEGGDRWYDGSRFPTLLADSWNGPTLTIREVFMLWCVEQITNKPDWNKKVFDDAILAKWYAEVTQAPWEEVTGFKAGGPCSEDMWKFVSRQ